jgi:hypothetical protein
MEGVYLMHTRECVNAELLIYKIGRSHNLGSRIKQYPNGSNVICALPCNNSIICEQLLLDIFKKKFIHKPTYGKEYFEGNYELMVQTMIDTLFTNKTTILENYNKLKEEKKMKTLEKKKKREQEKITVTVIEKEKEKEKDKEIKLKTETEKIKLCCPKCNLSFKYPSKLKIHLKKSYHCKKNSEEIKEFFLVIKNIKSNKEHKCTICNKCFSRKDSYVRHNKLNKCKNIL